ncbi:MAG: cold shock domain-containing protein [Desulfatiglans sp.]|nr:cold shock domain-containing protein [Desulfatiglans sp.]
MMNDIPEIRKRASELRKTENYTEAASLYGELWLDHREVCNEWDGWGYATCLRKTGNSEMALEICREVYKEHPKFEKGNDLYAWCIYDTEIKKSDEDIKKDEKSFYKAANAILELTQQSQYSPYTKTVFQVIDYITKNNASYPADNVLQWVNRLDPKSLSHVPFSFKDKEQKEREILSDHEKYYTVKTKALYIYGVYQECIDLCNAALKEINKFHYNNDIWLKRRVALAKSKLGDKESALTELECILIAKKEWFIQYELAQICYEMGDREKALKYCVEAALNYGKDENKWELFLFMAQILKDMGEPDIAKQHLAFAVIIREEKGWKIPETLNRMISECDIQDIGSLKRKELYSQLKSFWDLKKYSDLPLMNGTVKTILPNGKAGFITGDDKNDYYFEVSEFKGNIRALNTGLKVKYSIANSFDKKKNIKTKKAILIKEIKENRSA